MKNNSLPSPGVNRNQRHGEQKGRLCRWAFLVPHWDREKESERPYILAIYFSII